MKGYFYLLLVAAFMVPFCARAQEETIDMTPRQITEIVNGSNGNIEVIIPDDINMNIFPELKNRNNNTSESNPTANNQQGGNSVQKTQGQNTQGQSQQGRNQATNNSGNKNNNNKNTANNKQQQQQTVNKNQANNKTSNGPKTMKKTQGFRIQVFSDGQNPQTLQSRARARGNAIVARFPKYRGQVYTFSSSPNWYTRVGNFETQAEASRALGELKAAFPQFAGEMRIVKSPVTIVK